MLSVILVEQTALSPICSREPETKYERRNSANLVWIGFARVLVVQLPEESLHYLYSMDSEHYIVQGGSAQTSGYQFAPNATFHGFKRTSHMPGSWSWTDSVPSLEPDIKLIEQD